jgi:CSLREA domain-containing protein
LNPFHYKKFVDNYWGAVMNSVLTPVRPTLLPVWSGNAVDCDRPLAKTLVVIDSAVADAGVLSLGLWAGVRVVMLRPDREGVEQITDYLKQYPEVTQLVVMAHGEPGCLKLGDRPFTGASIQHHRQRMAIWGQQIDRIVLYSCQVAEGAEGQAFLAQLYQATGVAIAASTRPVGSASQGGAWSLDTVVGGAAEADLSNGRHHFNGQHYIDTILRPEIRASYTGLLGTLIVNSLDDNSDAGDGNVTLREAIAAANADTVTDLGDQASGIDTIIFDAALSDSIISLNLGELLIDSDVIIDGSTAPGLIVSGNLSSRVFNITDGSTIIDSLTISDGAATDGAGIRVENASLTLDNSLLNEHVDSGAGGAIYASGALLSINNTTITDNTSATFGAGMTLVDGTAATVTFSTIVNNQGSGIDRVGDATVTIGHTILADNTRGNIPLSSSNTTSLNYNLTDDITIGLNQSKDKIAQTDAAINLGFLGDNGGATQTVPVLPGSIAINAGDPTSTVNQDQRGVTRPAGARVDIGAFEAALPVVTVNPVVTNDSTPELTGTVTLEGGFIDDALVVRVTIDGVEYLANNNGDGTWTLPNDITAPIDDGTYDVQVSVTNVSGTGTDATTNELVIDTAPPVVTIDALSTNDSSPELTGTVDSADAEVVVTVDGVEYTAQNNGDGTWVLADDAIAPLAEATYDVAVTATDSLGNIGVDSTLDELVIDLSSPTVTLDAPILTNDATPSLSGTIDDPSATIEVTINRITYIATNNGDGTWTLADDQIDPPLADDAYDVVVAATDEAGNLGTSETIDALTIDTVLPVITVDEVLTADATPTLTGNISEPVTSIRITVNGVVYDATSDGETWSLNGDLIFPALGDGTFDVIAQATDLAGNIGVDDSLDELTVDTTPPTVTVTPLDTNDATPEITGTIDDLTATLSVTINGVAYDAVNNANGTWTLADGAIALPLDDGTYDVSVTATDAVGNVGTDDTTDELFIDTVSPTVAIDRLITSDTTPPLTGTVNDPDATVTVTLDGEVYTAVNNGDGTWALADDLVNPPLADAAYDVSVSAEDAVGNIGVDDTADDLIIDTTAPQVTVNPLITNDPTPELTGTVSEASATVDVTIAGETYTATNNGDGTWIIEDDVILPLDDGTIDVSVVATDEAGNVGTDDTLDELVVDTIAPVVTLDDLGTNDPSPPLSGTIDDPTATIAVTVDRRTYQNEVINVGDGTWVLPDNTIDPDLDDGTYDIQVLAIDVAGNTSTTTASLIIDTVAPVVTVDALSTNDATPELTGTISEPGVSIEVTVDGNAYTAQNNGDGTWTLADDLINPPLDDGTFEVSVVATDAGGNTGSDETENELLIDTQAPTITVDALATTDNTPPITGTIDDPDALIQLTIDRNAYTATNLGDGTWILEDDSITPALADGIFDIEAVASDAVGNLGTDSTVDELFVDATPPTVTIDSLLTSDNTPELTGTIDDPTATVEVTVDGTSYTATVNGDGTWTLADGTIDPALADNTYDVVVTGTDPLGNVGTDDTTDELVVDTTAPVVTIDSLSTNDNTPTLTGTIDDPTASLEVTVNGTVFPVTTINGTTWELPLVDPLDDNTYDIVAVATDLVGNEGTDGTVDELVIDTVAPVVTIDSLATNDTTPPLSGTVDDPTATVQVGIGIQVITANNNGDGTWTVDDNVIAPALPEGVFDFKVLATDAVGNEGQDTTVNELTIDTTAPTVDIVDVTPDPRGPVNAIALIFSEAVSGLGVSDFILSRDGGAIALTGATLSSTDNITWTLGNLTALTTLTGTYSLVLPGASTGVVDEVGNILETSASDVWRVENLTTEGLPAPASINGQIGTAPPPIDFSGGRAGIREAGTGDDDRLVGTGGRDRFDGRGGDDRLFGRGGNDRLVGSSGNDRLFGENGSDRLDGSGGSDRLDGGGGRDRLRGENGSDRLLGGGGSDIIIGGGGADRLTGNAGRDQFVFESLSDGVDTITDFNTTDDFIDFTRILSSSQFAASSGFEKIRQFVRLNQVGNTTEVSIDADGNGSGTTLQRMVILQGVNSDAVVSTNFLA